MNDDNYFIWTKGQAFQLSEHFSSFEFECQCDFSSCKEQLISKLLINKAETVRVNLNLPITVTSGYRCKAHQAALTLVGYQTAQNSQHVLGNAWDSRSPNMTLLRAELEKEFDAIGVATNFIHSDLRADKKRLWLYNAP